MAADACAEVISSILDRMMSDNGPGGLNNPSSAAYVRRFYRSADPDMRSPVWPYVIIIANADYFDTLKGPESSRGGVYCRVGVIITTDRDAGFGPMNEVTGRVRTLLHRQTIANGLDWQFSPVRVEAIRYLDATGKDLRAMVDCRVLAARLGGGL